MNSPHTDRRAGLAAIGATLLGEQLIELNDTGFIDVVALAAERRYMPKSELERRVWTVETIGRMGAAGIVAENDELYEKARETLGSLGLRGRLKRREIKAMRKVNRRSNQEEQ